MNEIPSDDIEKTILSQIDDLSKEESAIAETFGAVKYETTDEKIDRMDKGKDELFPEPQPETPKVAPEITELTETDVKSKTKQFFIDNILKIQKTLGTEEYTEQILRRKKKAELEELFRVMFEKAAQKAIGFGVNKAGNVELTGSAIVEAMFMGNLVLAQSAEFASQTFKSSTFDVALLEGWTDIINERKETLMCILKDMYAQNKVAIDKIVSPLLLYALFMTTTGINCGMQNFKNKKKDLKQESITE